MEFCEDQASSRIELENGTIITKCDQCRQMWKERNERGIEGEPPCKECWTEPFEENEDAFKIFFLTRSQLIMGQSPIDVNHLAIYSAMDLYDIKNRRECFEKVMKLSKWWIKKLKDSE